MSHSFYLNVKSLTVNNVLETTGFGDIRFVAGYPAPENDQWPQGYTYLYRDRVSARALETEYDGDTVRIRIFAASSPEDYQLALAIVAAISRLYSADITPEDNTSMGLENFQARYNQAWAEEHSKTTLRMIIDSIDRTDGKTSQVSGVGRAMTIGERVIAQIQSDKSRIDREFFYRLKKLNYIDSEDIFPASIIVVKNQSGDKNVRLATYSEGVPTLLCDKKTVAILRSDDNFTGSDETEMLYIPLDKLPGLIGEEAKWISEDLLLVPGLQGEQWQALIEKARTMAVNDIFEYGYDPNNDPFENKEGENKNNRLTDEDMAILACAPVAVFMLVAGADGNVDKKEIKAFQAKLLEGMVLESPLLQKVLVTSAMEFETIVAGILSKEIDIKTKFAEVVHILDRLPEADALKFKISLLTMGKAVAEASGGFFGGKISKEEKQALVILAALLGVGN